jgi:plasmid maintenance system antidote protein VapI
MRLSIHSRQLIAQVMRIARVASIIASVTQPPEIPQVSDKNPAAVGELLTANLRWHMKRRGMLQPELARRSGVAQSVISTYVSPPRSLSPSLFTVQALAQALGLEAWQLLRPPTLARQRKSAKKPT